MSAVLCRKRVEMGERRGVGSHIWTMNGCVVPVVLADLYTTCPLTADVRLCMYGGMDRRRGSRRARGEGRPIGGLR